MRQIGIGLHDPALLLMASTPEPCAGAIASEFMKHALKNELKSLFPHLVKPQP
jgi:hypothetical protein